MSETEYDLRLARTRINELLEARPRSGPAHERRHRRALARSLHRFADRLES